MNEDDLYERLSRPDIYDTKRILENNVWDIIGATDAKSPGRLMTKINDEISKYQSNVKFNGLGDLVIIDKDGKHITVMKNRNGYEMELAKKTLDDLDERFKKDLTEQGIRSQKKISKVNPNSRKGKRLWNRELNKFSEKLRKSLNLMYNAIKIYIPFD